VRVRGVVRSPLLAVAVLSLIGSPAAAAEPVVRVLLYQGAGPVRIQPPGGAGAVEIAAAGGALRVDEARMERWTHERTGISTWNGMRVRGRVEVLPSKAGLAVVNAVPLEDYVAGTLGREMFTSWQPAALRAQAVVSRTYALHQQARRHRGGERAYDVEAGTASQVYGGVDAETASVRDAVERTGGQILTYRGEPILAVFHSASGGRTASAEEAWGRPVPYLRSVSVEDEDDSPATYWRAAITHTTLVRALEAAGQSIGEFRSMRVAGRSRSGRVVKIEIEGSRGRVALGGRELRTALGESTLKSTMFEVRSRGDELVFVGSGHGHGVGMSQWGARAMAERGDDHREILSRFYPGTRIESVASRSRQTLASGAAR